MVTDLPCVSQSLWVERTSLFLVQSLPGISRWFEVDKREVVRPAACSQHSLVSAAHLQSCPGPLASAFGPSPWRPSEEGGSCV